MGIGSKIKNLFTIDYEDDYDDYLDNYYDEVDEKPKRSSKSSSKESKYDTFDDEEPVKVQPKPKVSRPSRHSRKVVPMRSSKSSFEVCVIKPTEYNYVMEVISTILNGKAVVLNLEGLMGDTPQRIIDTTSGACFAIGGDLQRVSGQIYLVTPGQIEITGDITDFVSGIDINADPNSVNTY